MRNKILAELAYIFTTTPDEVEKYVDMMQLSSSDNCLCNYNINISNLSDPELQLINIKPMIKNKLKEFLSKFKV